MDDNITMELKRKHKKSTKEELLERKAWLEEDNKGAWKSYWCIEILKLNKKELQIIDELLKKLEK